MSIGYQQVIHKLSFSYPHEIILDEAGFKNDLNP
jgi:hypothetical protein